MTVCTVYCIHEMKICELFIVFLRHGFFCSSFFFFFFFFVASIAGLAKHLKFLCFPATLVLKSCSSFNTLHFLIILEKWTNSQRLEHPWSWQRYWSQLIRHATFALSCFSCSGKAQDSSQRKFFPHFFWEKIRVIS